MTAERDDYKTRLEKMTKAKWKMFQEHLSNLEAKESVQEENKSLNNANTI